MLELKIDEKKKTIFAPLLGKDLVMTPEELVRQTYICTLVNQYGYDLKQMEQEIKVSNSKRGLGKARADIVIYKSEQDKTDRKFPVIVVECKAESVKLQRGDFFQGANYASWARAKFFVCLNLKEHRVFRTDEETMPIEFLDEITDFPKAKDIGDEAKIQAILAQRKTFSKTDFQNLLFKCHNVFRDNDALAPDAAFDEISKILFMKINYERNRKMGEEEKFTKALFEQQEKWFEENVKPGLVERNPNDSNLTYLDFWFENTKRRYAEEKLFEQNDKIKISKGSFLKVVKELEAYNLSDTDDDIKGVAFEEFLSKTFRGKGLGQFFTPRTIVKFMTQILDPQEGEMVCDPCCGSGGFLIYTFEFIKEKIEKDIEKAKETVKNQLLEQLKGKEKLSEKEYEKLENEVTEKIEKAHLAINRDLDNKQKGTRLHSLSFECIFGTDKEARSARMAKMNMIMHGDGHGGVHQYEGLLNINGISDGKFDVILTNPPFGSRVGDDLKDPNDTTKKVVDYFNVSPLSKLKEVMFTDRCLNLLKPSGRMGIVLPEGFLNNSQLQNVRDYFEGRAKILLIVSIPQEVFTSAGATVKPSLVFLRKFSKAEAKQYAKTVADTTQEMNDKYQPEIDEALEEVKALEDYLAVETDKERIKVAKQQIREEKAKAQSKIKEIEERKVAEIKATVKERWNYEIPVAQVDKAGISSTGGATDNELDSVAEEFKPYRIAAKLWQNEPLQVDYAYEGDKTYRIINGKKEEIK